MVFLVSDISRRLFYYINMGVIYLLFVLGYFYPEWRGYYVALFSFLPLLPFIIFNVLNGRYRLFRVGNAPLSVRSKDAVFVGKVLLGVQVMVMLVLAIYFFYLKESNHLWWIFAPIIWYYFGSRMLDFMGVISSDSTL